MSLTDFFELGLFFTVLLILAYALARYIFFIFNNNYSSKIENIIYKFGRINIQEDMNAFSYSKNLIIFNILGFLCLFTIILLQKEPKVSWDLAINIAISFVTNTNWQSYAGEVTLSHMTQSIGLGVQNFLSPAVGLCVLLVLIRGLRGDKNLGNFYGDLIKSILYIFLPLALISSFLLSGLGVMQNFSSPIKAFTLEEQEQIIPMGPVASQVAIKQLGSNGGGFFGQNSAHPLENPNIYTNFLELLLILLMPVSLIFVYGLMLNKLKHSNSIFLVQIILFFIVLFLTLKNELNYVFNLEGKELRFGVVNSVLWSVATTATSNGSVNAMLDSFSPLAGGLCLFLILLGEIVFGGVGVGMIGMSMFVILTVFLCGLMVGRSPSYLGKKLEAKEMILALITLLLPSALVLIGASVAISYPESLKSISQPGPHGLTQILYAFASAANNNGSALMGLNASTPFYNLSLALIMLLGRFSTILPAIYISQSFIKKRTIAPFEGELPIHGGLFVSLLLGIIVLIGALNFLPVLTLGPVLEHFLLVPINL